MRDTEHKPLSVNGALVALVVFLLALPVVYVLSIGPVARAVPNPPDWLEAFYMPLLWPAEKFPAFGRVLDWYMELWGAH